jgi:hypothetical protein
MHIEAESEVRKYINGVKDSKTEMYENLEEDVVDAFSDIDGGRKIKSTTDIMTIKTPTNRPPKSSKIVKSTLTKDNKLKTRTSSVKNDTKLVIRDSSSEARKVQSSKSINERVRTESETRKEVLNTSDNRSSPDKESQSSIEKREMSKTTYIMKKPFERIEEKEGYNSEDSSLEEEKLIKLQKAESKFSSNVKEINKEIEYVSAAKYELLAKKLADTENRLYELENNSRKKLEELASQVKVYIPINFNVKQSDNKPQINIETYKTDNNNNQVNYNILDPALITNPQSTKNRVLRGDSRKSRTVLDNTTKLKKIM